MITTAFKISLAILLVLVTFIHANIPFTASGRPVQTTIFQDTTNSIFGNAKPVLISEQFAFTEGPAVDKKGNIFFTDQPNNKIWKYTTAGKLEVFMENAGRANGTYFDKKGNLVVCADENDQLWSISTNKKVSIILKDYKGKRFNGPNDLWIHPKGGIYFTDPYYQRSYWTRKSPDLDGEKLYLLPKGEKEAVIMDEDLKKPNGITGSPDGKYLFVADIKDNKTYRYEIGADGRVSNRALFAPQGSDGMTIDQKGNIYRTGNGVTVFNAQGEKIAHVDVPGKWTANVCFGGKKREMLFITSSTAVYVLPTLVRGVE